MTKEIGTDIKHRLAWVNGKASDIYIVYDVEIDGTVQLVELDAPNNGVIKRDRSKIRLLTILEILENVTRWE
jgi:hypothetical protein